MESKEPPSLNKPVQAPSNGKSIKEKIQNRVSVYDAHYPTPEQCRRILSKNFTQQVPILQATLPSSIRKDTNLNADAKPIMPEALPDTILNERFLVGRLMEHVPKCQGVEKKVTEKISEVAENQLRELLYQLSQIANHRLEPLKTNPMYDQISDPRKQLKFIEEQEKQAFDRREAEQKDAVMKATKAKDKDVALAAREMRTEIREEKRNNDANKTAIAVLATHRTIPSIGLDSPVDQEGMPTQLLRLRIRRITLRDFQCFLTCRKVPGTSLIKSQLAYKRFRFTNN